MTRGARAVVLAVLAGVACTEHPTAPGACPDLCPSGQIAIVDTLLATVVERDTAYTGYLFPRNSATLIAASVPGTIDSRPILRFDAIGTTFQLGTDTTQHPIVATDSARLTVSLLRRDTSVRNLRVRLYRLPIAIDTTTAFGDLTGPFTDSLVRDVNVDSLIRAGNQKDTVTKDSVHITGAVVTVMIGLDSAQARFVVADSGTLAYGIRITGDAPTSAVFGSNESSVGPLVNWFFRVDSAGTTAHGSRIVGPQFDSFVFDPPAAAPDSTLIVGGMPAARSLVHLALPRRLRDSTQILRATLELVTATPAQGAAVDSFTLVALAIAADLGGKSPTLSGSDSSYFGTGIVTVGSTDTVRVEITRILRRWAADTTLPNAFVLRSGSEGVVLSQIRFEPSKNAARRPIVRLTYASKFPFGIP
jgi:hypothetical protein